MTFQEFNAKVEGYFWTREAETRNRAWALANIINSCRPPSKNPKRISVEKLVHRQNISPKNPYYRRIGG